LNRRFKTNWNKPYHQTKKLKWDGTIAKRSWKRTICSSSKTKKYATSKPDKAEEILPTLPRINNPKKSTAEIHLAMNHSLQQTQEIARRLAKKKKPTKNDTAMIEATRNATQAYIELANRTYEGRKRLTN
jgi:hypothetical protein